MKCAVCVIVKNEARDFAEWLAFQSAVGFDAVIAYDHLSTDATPSILDAAGRVMDVRRVSWSRNDNKSQFGAYQDCLATFGSEFDWIAFFDSDEFLLPNVHPGIRELLDSRADAAMLAVNWAVFGSAGQVGYPGGLLIESFTKRAANTFGPNGHVKSIVRPDRVREVINPHLFAVDGMTVLPDGTPVEAWSTPGVTRSAADHSVCQLNHYFVRSRAHWDAKVLRGRFHGTPRGDADFISYDRNEVTDTGALRFAPQVHATIMEMGLPAIVTPATG